MGSSTESEVTLFTHRCSYFAHMVEIALKEKGIPYKRVPVDLKNKPKELLEVNPLYGTVPSMVHNGNPILESLIILEYLEDAWPHRVPLVPKDPVARSKVRFWVDYIFKIYLDIRQTAFFLQEGSPEKQAALAKVPKSFKTIDSAMTEYSAEGPFFGGDKFGHLDVVLGPWICYSAFAKKVMNLNVGTAEELPRLFKWMETMKAHKSVQEVLPSADELLAYFARRFKEAEEAAQAQAQAGKANET